MKRNEINNFNIPAVPQEPSGSLTSQSNKGELVFMKNIKLLAILILFGFTSVYAQYSESYISSNPNYRAEMDARGFAPVSLPASVNYKPLGVITWSEGFENTTFPPTGWASHNLDAGTQQWTRYTTTPIFGTASAAATYESTTLQNDDWLRTHQFVVSAGAVLNFYAKRQSTAYVDSVEIFYSTSGGTPPSGYTRMTKLMPAGTTAELFQVSLNSLAGQNIYLAFRYNELDQWRLYLDSMFVEVPTANDVGVMAIVTPGTTVDVNTAYTPRVVVKNFGSTASGAFQTRMTINPGGYLQTVNVSSLAPGAVDSINFANWTPTTSGNYQVTAFTMLTGDSNPSNDTGKVTTFAWNAFNVQYNINASNLYPAGVSWYGTEFDGTYFYLSKWNENKMWRVNKAGTTIDSFTVGGLAASSGFRDLAFDGTDLYGAPNTTTVYKIDKTTFAATTAFTAPFAVRGISYNKAANAFYVAGWSGNISLVSRTGTVISSIAQTVHGLTGMAGNAYDTLSSGGPFLWVWDDGLSTNTSSPIVKLNATTGARVDSFNVASLHPATVIGGGLFVTNQYQTGTVTLGSLNQSAPHRLIGFQIGGSASTVAVDIPITVTDNAGGTATLKFGLDPTATDGIDASLGEQELPPPPPTGVFDARFIGDDIGISIGQGLAKDYRQGTTTHNGQKIHEFKYQVGTGTTITFNWNMPTGVTGRLQDLITGSIIDVAMSGTGNYTVTNPGVLNKLKMTVTYALGGTTETVQLTSPNGGENWFVGASKNITWTSSNITNVKLEYTTNNGTSWSTVAASVPATPATYAWTVPSTPTTQAKVKVSDAADGTPADESDAVFTISTPPSGTITVLSPNGGEKLNAGAQQIVVWKSTGSPGNVDVLASTDGGATFGPVFTNIPNNGFAAVPAPTILGTNYRVKVQSNSAPTTIFDVSDSSFSIVAASTVLKNIPVVVSDQFFSQILRVGIDPSATDGIDAALGEFELPPTPPSTVFDGRLIGDDIGIIGLGQGVLSDFRQGASTFDGNKIHELKYQMGPLAKLLATDITIYWSLPANVTGRLQDLVTGALIDVPMSGDGKYLVANPSTYSKLKMTLTYTVPTTSSITVLSPNGGESFKQNAHQVIAWKSLNVSGNVNIKLSADGGTTYPTTIASNVANSGVYGWNTGTLSGTQYRVRVESATTPTTNDASNANFTVSGAQTIYQDNPFVISDGTTSVLMRYGIDPAATDGIDAALGEAELPPVPPTGVFDGRFIGTDIGVPGLGQGSLKDYRQGTSAFSGNKIHEIFYQMGSTGDSLRLFWNLPTSVTGLLQDIVTGTIVNVAMSGAGTYTVANPGVLSKLKITLTYTAAPASVTLVSPNGGENWPVGSTQNIVWTATGIATVKLEYTTNNGTSWINIGTAPAVVSSKTRLDGYNPKDPAGYIEGEMGTYPWTIPNTPSNSCKVRVSDNANAATNDVSDNTFTISAPTTEGWTLQTSGTTATLYTVHAVSDQVAWAGGLGGVVIRTTNGGTNWTTVTSPRAIDIHNIFGSDANIAFAISNGTTDAVLYRTSNGGTSWQAVYTQAGGFFNHVEMFDANNGYFQGDPLSGIWTLMKTTNGGLNWTSATSLTQAGTEYGWNNSMWWVGQNGWFGTNNSRVYRTTNGGANWTSVTTTSLNSYAVAFSLPAKGLAGFATGVINKSIDGGATWTAATNAGASNVGGLTAIPGTDEFFAAGGSIVYKTSNQGTAWTTSYTATTTMNHISFKTSGTTTTGWAVGNTGVVVKYVRAPQTPAVTVVTPNGGESWAVGSVQNIVWNAQLVSKVKLEYTTNNGTSWNTIGYAPAKTASKVRLDGFNPKDPAGLIEGELGIYAWTIPNTPSTQCKVRVSDSTNAAVNDVSDNVFTISEGVIGENWTVQTSNTTATLYSVSTVDANIAWAGGLGGVVIRTTNGGTTWSVVTSPRATDVYNVKAIDANKCLVTTSGTADTKIHLTTNGGTSWTDVYTQAGGFINVIEMFDANNGYAQGDPVSAAWTLLKTTNGGASWTSAATLAQAGAEAGWNNSWHWVGTTGWFGTNNSRVYKTTDGGATWTNYATTVVNSYSVAFGSASKGFTGSATGTANISSNGGVNWVANTTPATGNILGATSVAEDQYWFTSGNNVYYTSNHGSSWSTSHAGAAALNDVNIKGLGGANAVGYAVGSTGRVVKYFRGVIPPSIVVTAPNGGENWTVGSTKQISWTSLGVTRVKLEFTTDNGGSWNLIGYGPALLAKSSDLKTAEGLDKFTEEITGVYNWLIPNTPSSQCKVRVSDSTNAALFDVSDNTFTISPAGVGPVLQFSYDITALSSSNLRAMYGAEFDGSNFWITRWSTSFGTSILFKINKAGTAILDSGAVTGFPSGAGLRDLAWDGQYLYGSNYSTTIYKIDPATKTVVGTSTSPVAVRGISYSSADDGFFVADWGGAIYLIRRNGTTIRTIQQSVHGLTGMSGNAYDTLSAGGPYLWVWDDGSSTNTTSFLVKLNAATGARVDSFDLAPTMPATVIGGGLFVTDQFQAGTYTLGGLNQSEPHTLFGYKIGTSGPTPGTITVLSPNGGEKLYAGRMHFINWSVFELTGNVNIRLSSDGGTSYPTVLASGIPASRGWYAFAAPTALGTQYKVKIEASANNANFDESDANFSVVAAPAPISVDVPLVVSDTKRFRLLRFGLDPAATDGINAGLGEEELPPPPPTGVFDARFIGDDIGITTLGQGIAMDYRQGVNLGITTKIHELKFQRMSGNNVVIYFHLPADVKIRFQNFTGTTFDTTVSGTGMITVLDSLLSKLKLTVNYFPNAVLGSFNLTTPSDNGVVTVKEGDTTSVSFKCGKAFNAVKYVWRMGVPFISPYFIEYVCDNSGADSALTKKQKDLYTMLYNVGARDSISGQWAIWAYKTGLTDSLRSTSAFNIKFKLVPLVNVDPRLLPTEYTLYQNYPNPFNPSTKIKFGIPQESNVTVEVFNVVGERIAVLMDEHKKAGYYELTLDAKGMESGVYFYKITAGNFVNVKKMVLLK